MRRQVFNLTSPTLEKEPGAYGDIHPGALYALWLYDALFMAGVTIMPEQLSGSFFHQFRKYVMPFIIIE
jgi:hypothetical protein